MQTQKRNQLHTPQTSKRAPALADKRAPKSAPVELDTRALKHVAGGVDGPNKYW